MALDLGSLLVKVGADTKGLTTGLSKSTDMIKKMGTNIQSLGRQSALVFGAMGAVSVVTAKKLLKLASASEEMQNVLSTVFKSDTSNVKNWAKSIGVEMGRSTLQMESFASSAGSVLQGMDLDSSDLVTMSKGFSQLAVDIGSFFNVADDQAFNALRSGITGRCSFA